MRIRPVTGIPEITPDHDIGRLLDEIDSPADDDIVVVASTIVSKAEDRGRQLSSYEPDARATEIARRFSVRRDEEKDPRFAAAVLAESEEVLLEDPFLLTVTKFGHTCVNAGIDRTNVPASADILLLPEDPMASARAIRSSLASNSPVVVADTCGRPFRLGQRGVAIGWAGMPATRDWRGMTDRDGRELHVTVEAVVDELAAAANLVIGEADGGVPVAYVEDWYDGQFEGGDHLFREPETDFVRQALQDWTYDSANDIA